MYPKRSNMRFMHKMDVYSKTSSENDTGQLIADWSLDVADAPCSFTPSGSATSIRTTPTTEESDYHTILIPHDVDIDYGYRIYNIKDRLTGEIIFSGPFQIDGMKSHVSSMSGRVQFIQLKVSSVIE